MGHRHTEAPNPKHQFPNNKFVWPTGHPRAMRIKVSFPPRIKVWGKLQRESRIISKSWIPAFAGITKMALFIF
jgi:hypothetical protein